MIAPHEALYLKGYEDLFHNNCMLVGQKLISLKTVISLKFSQRMSDKELHRRLITGTINTCSVTSKTVTMLSTNAQQSITQAKVSISKIILEVIYEKVDCNLH